MERLSAFRSPIRVTTPAYMTMPPSTTKTWPVMYDA